MKDTAESQNATKRMILTEVSSGKNCILIGVVKGRHERRFGKKTDHSERKSFFSEFRKRWEEQKEAREWEDGDFSEGVHWKHRQHHGHHMGGGIRILRRLLDLGITKGCSFLVIQGSSSGPVLVQVRGTRVALGQGIASKMFVQVVD